MKLTYKGTQFYMDGEPINIISGAMHYFRIPKEYWRDRMVKLKECGFNTLETYTCWNLHEPHENQFDFSGNLDLEEYIKTAESLGLYVIVRPGPYICAEWEFGGLPSWILKYENLPLRCYDKRFTSLIRRYYTELFKYVRPHLASNGGNVIMLQVENEYGSYGDDKEYLHSVANLYKELDMDCMYFTSDGPTYTMLEAGTLPEYFCVANFGSKPREQFKTLIEFRPDQPIMCGEYWCGWFDHWYESHHVRPASEIVSDFADFIDMNSSVNFYMFHGGTNFGFMNGANYAEKYTPTITSYDYNSPLNEAGDRTETYYKMREIIENKFGKLPPMTATETEKKAYGTVTLTEKADLFKNLDNISKCQRFPNTKYMEDLDQSYGYILYSSTINGPRNDWDLNIDNLHDRAQIFVNGELKGTYERWVKDYEKVKIPLGFGENCKIDILVENMGRVNYGPKLLDRKGISGVRFGGTFHFGWDHYCLPMTDELDNLKFEKAENKEINGPVFLKGNLKIDGEPCDTFLRLDGFTKGFVKVNGTNIGRYFNPAGPQKTLFVPAPFLKSGDNEILVFESDKTSTTDIQFLDTPDLG